MDGSRLHQRANDRRWLQIRASAPPAHLHVGADESAAPHCEQMRMEVEEEIRAQSEREHLKVPPLRVSVSVRVPPTRTTVGRR